MVRTTLEYRVSGKWKLASYTLTSYGFDGKPGSDDLCVSGSTKLNEIHRSRRRRVTAF